MIKITVSDITATATITRANDIAQHSHISLNKFTINWQNDFVKENELCQRREKKEEREAELFRPWKNK